MEIFSALLALCAGNSPVAGEFPSQEPVTRCINVFIDLHLNKRLSKQSRRRWFETPWRSLWRHCNVLFLGNGIGDDCEEDSDGDSTPDDVDTCPYNPNINVTSFADYFTIELDPTLTSNPANWEVKDDGKEILQLAVTDMPLLFIGKLLLIGYLFWLVYKWDEVKWLDICAVFIWIMAVFCWYCCYWCYAYMIYGGYDDFLEVLLNCKR